MIPGIGFDWSPMTSGGSSGLMPMSADSRLVWVARQRRVGRAILGPYQRERKDNVWVDLREVLGSVAIASAVVKVTRWDHSGEWVDVTEGFEYPSATANPPQTVDERGRPVGGPGWVEVGVLRPVGMPRGDYVITVMATLSDSRVYVEAPGIHVTDRGDP